MTTQLKIMHIAGARPNFVKVAPLMAALRQVGESVEQILVHTGQHYDFQMSQVFFDELELPEPDEYLGVGSGTHAEQTAKIMLAFEPVLLKRRPDWVVVVGDVNSTLACALVCAKLGVPLAHVEAGLRSRDRGMPEELNRLLTDQLADRLFTPSRDADLNLLNEGIPESRIALVGNIMIDTLVQRLPQAVSRPVLGRLRLERGGYLLVTLHRPANVDEPAKLREIVAALEALARDWRVVFPVHPRTRQRIEGSGLLAGGTQSAGLQFLEPLGYLDFLALTEAAGIVLTDSGGIQEETTYLGVPCLTLRETTERPVTITHGTNRLVAAESQAILEAVAGVRPGRQPGLQPPELWDGQTAGRIARELVAGNF